MIIKRLKNLWELSTYSVIKPIEALGRGAVVLRKDIPTIQKKLATIIKEEKEDIFNQEKNDAETNQ